MENGAKSTQDKPVTVDGSSAPRPPASKSRVLYLGIVFAGMLAAKLFFDLSAGIHQDKRSSAVAPAALSAPEKKASFNAPEPDKNAGTILSEGNFAGLSAASVTNTDKNTDEANKEPPAPPLLILNGTFLSEGEEFAIINNQIVKAGDEIEGAMVKKIEANNVELEFSGRIWRISSEEN
ncbi:MAG: hypothetical protein WBE75_03600 [Candidatus Omnitrophota bacterium]|jgi:hypothetical protein